MSPNVLTVFIITLGLGTTFVFSSSHWLLAWMGLEINTLAMLPLMAHTHRPRTVEAATKYFLIQAAAAALIMFSALINAWTLSSWLITQPMAPVTANITMLALALKLGLAPAHFWLPEVLQGLSLPAGLILSTWQKLAPLALTIQIVPMVSPHLIIFLGLASTLTGGWGGLNQTQLRKILAYSSIAHLGWMVLSTQLCPHITLFYISFYLSSTTLAFLTLISLQSTTLAGLSTSWAKSPMLVVLFSLLLLSLGGLPPLAGFAPKWLILNEMVKQGLHLPATATALSALLCLYFYLRICYTTTLTISPNVMTKSTPWRIRTPKKHLILAATSTIALMLLPIIPPLLAWFKY
nr:NADH dehydrogenase subunit 2 [Idiacanthus fasciola]